MEHIKDIDKKTLMWVTFCFFQPIAIFIMWSDKVFNIIARIFLSLLYFLAFMIELMSIKDMTILNAILLSTLVTALVYLIYKMLKRIRNIDIQNIKNPIEIIKFYINSQKIKREQQIAKIELEKKEREKVFSLYRQGKFLPNMQCSIILHKAEICYLVCSAKRYEVKNRAVGYSGGYGGVSFHVAKGVNVHTGGSRGHVIRKDVGLEYPGTLYITSERIIFVGNNKNFSINMPKLINYKLYTDAVEFNTDKTTYCTLIDDAECAGAILEGAVNNFLRNNK